MNTLYSYEFIRCELGPMLCIILFLINFLLLILFHSFVLETSDFGGCNDEIQEKEEKEERLHEKASLGAHTTLGINPKVGAAIVGPTLKCENSD